MEENTAITTYSLKEDIIQNLRDAGCGEDMISEFVEAMRRGKMESGKRLLEMHRRSLLDDMHKAQKHIDCLDYLIWQMNSAGSASKTCNKGSCAKKL